MTAYTRSIISCDGRDCSQRIEGPGHIKREVWEKAQRNGWHRYANSHFCPKCWPLIEKFLKTGSSGGEDEHHSY